MSGQTDSLRLCWKTYSKNLHPTQGNKCIFHSGGMTLVTEESERMLILSQEIAALNDIPDAGNGIDAEARRLRRNRRRDQTARPPEKTRVSRRGPLLKCT